MMLIVGVINASIVACGHRVRHHQVCQTFICVVDCGGGGGGGGDDACLFLILVVVVVVVVVAIQRLISVMIFP
jgi:hypothetical protein